ncbi:scavenger receptor cysteine-rich type 1 protein M130-like [Sander lucioperca]|uniref:scavenger receptor cysteine-rich type 1 protein M130-like n=1 Tax=Sander lucioperca TaxID=283035 RepID=UPI001653D257|nr:scavenger receptor cysteine-rich type 1 protein M130-like [Sander lucioperca]
MTESDELLDSVRLVNGTSLWSGRLEVKTNPSTQGWSSVCEDDFDQQDAEVVCRELGCGAPSVLQGALYGEVEAPMRTKEFQCGGHELVGGASRKYKGEWRPVNDFYSVLTLKEAAAACRELDCGSALSVGKRESSRKPVWLVLSSCVESRSAQRECATSFYTSSIQDLICPDLLLQPDISVSSSMDGISEAQQQ